jgi:PAS domain S-box-containing protein
MDYRMIFTSPYPEMSTTIQKVSKELGFSVTIVEDTMDGAAEQVQKLVSQDEYEVIVSRAGTAQKIIELVDLPVVHCDNSDFDLMQAFIRAKKLGDKIGFLTYPEQAFPYKMGMLAEVLGFEVTQLRYQDNDDIVRQVKYAKETGIEVLVGGGRRVLKLIQDYGMKGMYILTSERTVRRALIRANEVAQYRIAAREKAERLNAVIHVSEEAILFVNKEGFLEMFNPAAEKVFGVESGAVLGLQCRDIVQTRLHHLFQQEDLFKGTGKMTIDDMIVTHELVKVGVETVGAVITCREISKIQQLENEIRREFHSKGLFARSTLADIRHKSDKMADILRRANYFAMTDSTVLITGETGTGKELIAQGIHNASQRRSGPFVAVNCAALPETLLESELFGYADGAFTGAKKGGRPGLFELAHCGTIFLDEIGEVSTAIQSRLLRVLQEREVMRVSGDRVIPVDIRIVAATNRNLWRLVKEGKFRSDLYFRINVLRIEVPPLRERAEDISTLVEYFLHKCGSALTWKDLSNEIQQFFLSYDWPGNIRQLENVVERYQLSDIQHVKYEADFIQDVIKETQLEEDMVPPAGGDVLSVQMGSMEEIEKQICEQMMERYSQNRTVIAEKLGISRTTLWKKLKMNEAEGY